MGNLSNLGPGICNSIPDELKQLADVYAFRKNKKVESKKKKKAQLSYARLKYQMLVSLNLLGLKHIQN